MESGYKFAVVFNRRFVGGYLDGHSLWDKARFVTWQAADDYRKWCHEHKTIPAKSAYGICPFVFDEAWVEAI